MGLDPYATHYSPFAVRYHTQRPTEQKDILLAASQPRGLLMLPCPATSVQNSIPPSPEGVALSTRDGARRLTGCLSTKRIPLPVSNPAQAFQEGTEVTGLNITADDQLEYNKWLATEVGSPSPAIIARP